MTTVAKHNNNIVVQVFLRDASLIESWIESSESIVKNEDLGKSIEEVEELIRRHNDFIKTVEAQEEKLNPIKRITKVLSYLSQLCIIMNRVFVLLLLSHIVQLEKIPMCQKRGSYSKKIFYG